MRFKSMGFTVDDAYECTANFCNDVVDNFYTDSDILRIKEVIRDLFLFTGSIDKATINYSKKLNLQSLKADLVRRREMREDYKRKKEDIHLNVIPYFVYVFDMSNIPESYCKRFRKLEPVKQVSFVLKAKCINNFLKLNYSVQDTYDLSLAMWYLEELGLDCVNYEECLKIVQSLNMRLRISNWMKCYSNSNCFKVQLENLCLILNHINTSETLLFNSLLISNELIHDFKSFSESLFNMKLKVEDAKCNVKQSKYLKNKIKSIDNKVQQAVNMSRPNLDYIIDKVDVNPYLLQDIKNEFNLREIKPENNVEKYAVISDIANEITDEGTDVSKKLGEPKYEFYRFVREEDDYYFINKYKKILCNELHDIIPKNGVVKYNELSGKIIFNVGIISNNDFKGYDTDYRIINNVLYKIENGEQEQINRVPLSYSNYIDVFNHFGISMFYVNKIIGDMAMGINLDNQEESILNTSDFTQKFDESKVFIYKDNNVIKIYGKEFYTRDRNYKFKRTCIVKEYVDGLYLKDINSAEVKKANELPSFIKNEDLIEVDDCNNFIRKKDSSRYLEESPEFKKIRAKTKQVGVQSNGIRLAVVCNKSFSEAITRSLTGEGFEVNTFDGNSKKASELRNIINFKPDVVVYPPHNGSHDLMWKLKKMNQFKIVYPNQASKIEILKELEKIDIYRVK